MSRVSDRNDWFEIWFQDKKDMISIMSHNMAAKADFDNTVDMFKTMEEKQVNNWCFYDLKKTWCNWIGGCWYAGI